MSAESSMLNRNLESAILFLQQEHAAMLKGLHGEISCLQKRCTDLIFQLAMHGVTIDIPGTTDNKLQQVKQELDISMTKITTLEKELADREKRIDCLEAEARSKRKIWLDERRAQSQTMNSLRAELEVKANNIAYLTMELHRLKQKSKHELLGAENTGYKHAHANSGITIQPGHFHSDLAHRGRKSQTNNHYIPTPPPREKALGMPAALSRLRRSGIGTPGIGSGSSSKPIVAVYPTSISQQSVLHLNSGRSSDSESPDIASFLPPPKKEGVQIVGVKQAPVLPPIPVCSSTSVTNINHSHPVLKHQIVSSTSQHRSKNTSPAKAETAIVTLAVENAAVSDSAWIFAQESHSSEYN